MNYREYPPAEPLSPFIRCYWTLEVTPTQPFLERMFLTGGGHELIVNLGGTFTVIDGQLPDSVFPGGSCFFIGSMSRAKWGRTFDRCHLFGVCFKPGGAALFQPTPANELTDRCIDIADIRGSRSRIFADRIIDTDVKTDSRIEFLNRYFLKSLGGLSSRYPYLERAVFQIRETGGRIGVECLARKIGVSRRNLERLFIHHAGLTPKKFCRLYRFRTILGRLADSKSNWASIALDAGYFDQSHLIRDFNRFTGYSPAAYMDRISGQTFMAGE
ncbi:MAG: AraC family transcriptional regulator [Deltaproteobacteria bacterium]|nr:AraC family transcriptional regulator [Deltaproteobacteria bacterium]